MASRVKRKQHSQRAALARSKLPHVVVPRSRDRGLLPGDQDRDHVRQATQLDR